MPFVVHATGSVVSDQPLHASRSLGQNFLSNPLILQRIAQSAKIKPGEHILEVGPGLGGLTKSLLDEGAKVTAIEKDRRLIQQLKHEYPSVCNNLAFLHCMLIDNDLNLLLPLDDRYHSVILEFNNSLYRLS